MKIKYFFIFVLSLNLLAQDSEYMPWGETVEQFSGNPKQGQEKEVDPKKINVYIGKVEKQKCEVTLSSSFDGEVRVSADVNQYTSSGSRSSTVLHSFVLKPNKPSTKIINTLTTTTKCEVVVKKTSYSARAKSKKEIEDELKAAEEERDKLGAKIKEMKGELGITEEEEVSQ